MSDIVHNTGYVTEGLNRLLAIFKGKPRIAAWLTSYLKQVQEAENAMWDVFFDRALQRGIAGGDLLAKLGKIVGQTSEGLPDPQFLTLITARIKANRSRGWRTDMELILGLLTGNATMIARDFPRASFYLETKGKLILPPLLIAQSFLGRAIGAGILLMFIWAQTPQTNTLTFGSVWQSVHPMALQSFGSFYASPVGGGQIAGAVHITGGAST